MTNFGWVVMAGLAVVGLADVSRAVMAGLAVVGLADVSRAVMAGLAVVGLADVGRTVMADMDGAARGGDSVGFTVLDLLVIGFFVTTKEAHAPTVLESPENGHHK